jgi:uncharacterized damage-inducible protein DinB
MLTTIEIFEKQWQSESGFTQKIFNALTDDSLSQSINDGHRTIGRIAWHICQTIPEMMNNTGLKLQELKAPVPTDAKVIQETYEKAAKALSEQVKSDWTDETLQEEDDLYGEKWKKGATLLILIKHEIHHRGQITVLMRQAGLIVPDIYGPAKEGWSNYNAEPPVV